MKKIFLYILLSFLSVATYAANELNEKQSAFRRELFSTLGKEGFNPDIDKDGDIKFEYEKGRVGVNNIVKKIWSAVLALTITTSLFPVNVFAVGAAGTADVSQEICSLPCRIDFVK